MSEVIWKKAMRPEAGQKAVPFTTPYYEAIHVPRTKAIDFNEREAELPDRRAFRTMSRAAMMLSVLGMSAKEVLDPVLKKDPFRVGVYFAVENGPVDYESTLKMKDLTQESFANDYKKNRSPTMYLKQLPNLAAGHFAIFLGIFGPMNVYNDSQKGALHALEQAELDLNEGVIDLAVVGASFSFENPLAVERNHQCFLKDKTLCEGAGLMVLKKSSQITDWSERSFGGMNDYFGIADQVIELTQTGT
jgi:3-oxoacyl-(acyl-carrier-protein) synthase